MNRKPTIQLAETLDLTLDILFPKVQMMKSKGIIFKKTLNRPHTPNDLI